MATTSKEKEILNVPPLRFREFIGNWLPTKLSDLLLLQNGINADSSKFGKGVKCISVSDILSNSIVNYSCVVGSIDIDLETLKRFSVTNGDIIFQRSSETVEDIGHSNVYLDSKTATFGGFVIRGKKISGYHPLFLKFLLDSPTYRRQIIRLGAGAQHYNIGQAELNSVTLNIPKTKEQEKIAKFMSIVDQRIETQKKIIEDIKLLSKAIRDRHFSQRPTRICVYKDYIQTGKAGGTPKTNDPDYYGGAIPFLGISDITQQGKHIRKTSKKITQKGLDESAAWLVPPGSLILSMYASVGLPAINDIALATSQAMYSAILQDPSEIEYLYQALLFFREHGLRALLETGTQSNINADEVNNIPIPRFSKNNESLFVRSEKIIDKALHIEEKTIQEILEVKQYCLHEMFI